MHLQVAGRPAPDPMLFAVSINARWGACCHIRTQAEQLLPVGGKGGGARSARHLESPRQLPGLEGHQADAALVAQERYCAGRLGHEKQMYM